MSGDIANVYGGAYDTQNSEGMDSYDPLPAGWYAAEVEKAEVKPTNAGTGYYLKLQLYILDDPYNGRMVFANINLRNPNQKAEQIGQKELTSFGRAVGLPFINDSSECLQRRLRIKLKITHSEVYGDQNAVIGYEPLDQAAPPPPQQQQPASQPYSPPPAGQQAAPVGQPAYTPPPQQQPAPAPAGNSGTMPWKR